MQVFCSPTLPSKCKRNLLHTYQPSSSILSLNRMHIVNSDVSTHSPAPILESLTLEMRFEKPSEIQASTLPLILDGNNVIAQAQSGAGEHCPLLCFNSVQCYVHISSFLGFLLWKHVKNVPYFGHCTHNLLFSNTITTGKTIAFVIGMLAKINLSHACTQALCLTPTRELANQILSDAVRPLSSRLRVTYEEALPGREIPRGDICRSQVHAHVLS